MLQTALCPPDEPSADENETRRKRKGKKPKRKSTILLGDEITALLDEITVQVDEITVLVDEIT
jgi:hypothetical protein